MLDSVIIQNIDGKGIARNLSSQCNQRMACVQTANAAVMDLEGLLDHPEMVNAIERNDGSYGIWIGPPLSLLHTPDFVVESPEKGVAYLVPKTKIGQQLFDALYTDERQ